MSNQFNLSWKLRKILPEIDNLNFLNEVNSSVDSKPQTHQNSSAEKIITYRPPSRRKNPKNRNSGGPFA
ncbi:MAG: hypothetical protein SWJ54_14415 [Cyanobacteriota bacterium]|nr:hypothetical protein [Cyanobacteriota bacterium]